MRIVPTGKISGFHQGSCSPAMNETVQAQLDRIETALTSLVDSIASYNPSIPAASNLLQADIELQDRLKQRTSAHPFPMRPQRKEKAIISRSSKLSANVCILSCPHHFSPNPRPKHRPHNLPPQHDCQTERVNNRPSDPPGRHARRTTLHPVLHLLHHRCQGRQLHGSPRLR